MALTSSARTDTAIDPTRQQLPPETVDPVLGQRLPKRKTDRSAPFTTETLDTGILDAPGPQPEVEQQAKVHIGADGEVVIDLTEGDASPTTDMACPNCGGTLHVDSVDTDIRAAQMECQDCQFRFVRRLQMPADDRLESGSAAEPKERGRFLRSRR